MTWSQCDLSAQAGCSKVGGHCRTLYIVQMQTQSHHGLLLADPLSSKRQPFHDFSWLKKVRPTVTFMFLLQPSTLLIWTWQGGSIFTFWVSYRQNTKATLSNPKTNPRIHVHLLCTSETIIVIYSYLMPHNICSKKMNALIVIGMEYNNVSLAFKVISDNFY